MKLCNERTHMTVSRSVCFIKISEDFDPKSCNMQKLYNIIKLYNREDPHDCLKVNMVNLISEDFKKCHVVRPKT